MTDFVSRTSVLGVSVVRLDSRHTLHSWAHPYLLGKVLVITPDSYFGLVEFHLFQHLLPSRPLNPSSVAGSSSTVLSPSKDWLCSSQKNDFLHRAVYGRSSCQNSVSGELFVIAFLSDMLLKVGFFFFWGNLCFSSVR